MNYLFWGMCIILFILVLIKQTKKVKSSEAYVIERHKHFYKVVNSKIIFIIPFLDKIKCVVNLNPQIKKCYPIVLSLADNTTTVVDINIFFKVIDAKKVAYLNKSLESNLESLATTELRNISGKLNSSSIKYIEDKFKEDLKSKLNKNAQALGCKIEDLKIEIGDIKDLKIKVGDNVFKNNIYSNVTSVVDYSMYSNNGLYIIIFIVCIVYILGNFYLKKAYVSTNNLCFYFIKVLLESLPNFFICILISDFILTMFKKNIKKKILRGTIGMAIIFLCIYDIIAEPTQISISENRTSNFSYKCAIISDIISNQTTTVDVSNITAYKDNLKSTGSRKI